MESLRDPTMSRRSQLYTPDYHPAEIEKYSTGSSTALQDNYSISTAGGYKSVSQVLSEDTVLPSRNHDTKSAFEHEHDTTIPSNEEEYGPAQSTCTWTIGWITPCLMLLPYVFALLVALAHISFCLWLRGKDTARLQQTYVTTASTIMANVVGLLLRLSLACVFTQCLWRVLRGSTFKASTIEDLFSMRSNVLALGRTSKRREAWMLLLNTVFLWSIPIAVSFPPGATTVVQGHELSGLDVLTFANFKKQIEDPSLDNLDYPDITGLYQVQDSEHPDGIWVAQPLSWRNEDDRKSLSKTPLVALAESTMMNARIAEFPSPCGPNCRYTFEFDGPYLNCSNTTSNTLNTMNLTTDYSRVYTASWANNAGETNGAGTSTMARLEIASLELLSMNNETGSGRNLNLTQTTLSCTPSRATYKVKMAYKDNIESIEVHGVYGRPLIDLERLLYWPKDAPPSNDTDKAHRLAFIEDSNIMAMIQAMGFFISGSVDGVTKFTSNNSGPIVDHVDGNGSAWFKGEFQVDGFSNETTNSLLYTPLGTTFNPSDWSISGSRFILSPKPFNVTQDRLNTLLINFTLSAIPTLGFWTTNVEVDRNLTTTEYAFSRPLNIAVPYGVLLGLALPFLVLGMWALYSNGVAAQDGGFFQILMTTRGSRELDRVARGGCLGGDENVPRALKDLRLRFGTFSEHNDPAGVSLAGFGTENEVTAIEKGRTYGAA